MGNTVSSVCQRVKTTFHTSNIYKKVALRFYAEGSSSVQDGSSDQDNQPRSTLNNGESARHRQGIGKNASRHPIGGGTVPKTIHHGFDKALSKKRYFVCFCGVICNSLNSHRRHVKETGNELFRFGECHNTFMNLNHVVQHQRQAHATTSNACKICGELFTTFLELREHQVEDHDGNSISRSSDNPRPPQRPNSSILAHKRRMAKKTTKNNRTKVVREKKVPRTGPYRRKLLKRNVVMHLRKGVKDQNFSVYDKVQSWMISSSD